jgi:IS30 family transposase
MIDQHNIKQIARLLGRDKFTFSREMRRNAWFRGHKAKQASDLTANVPNRAATSTRLQGPAYIKKLLQVDHWEIETVIGAKHKQAIDTVVERKSGYAFMAKVSNKTADLV